MSRSATLITYYMDSEGIERTDVSTLYEYSDAARVISIKLKRGLWLDNSTIIAPSRIVRFEVSENDG